MTLNYSISIGWNLLICLIRYRSLAIVIDRIPNWIGLFSKSLRCRRCSLKIQCASNNGNNLDLDFLLFRFIQLLIIAMKRCPLSQPNVLTQIEIYRNLFNDLDLDSNANNSHSIKVKQFYEQKNRNSMVVFINIRNILMVQCQYFMHVLYC